MTEKRQNQTRRTEKADICGKNLDNCFLSNNIKLSIYISSDVVALIVQTHVDDSQAQSYNFQQTLHPVELDLLDPQQEVGLYQDDLHQKRDHQETHDAVNFLRFWIFYLEFIGEAFHGGENGKSKHEEERNQELDVEEHLDLLPFPEDETLQQGMMHELISFPGVELDVGQEVGQDKVVHLEIEVQK